MSRFYNQLKRLLSGQWDYGLDCDFLKRAKYVRENAGLEWVAAYDEVIRSWLWTKKSANTCHRCDCCGRRRSRKKAFAAWKGPIRMWICEECNRWIKFAKDNAYKVQEAVYKLKLRELTEGSDFLTTSNTKRKKQEKQKKREAKARLKEKVLKKVQARLMAGEKLSGKNIIPELSWPTAAGPINRRCGKQGYRKATSNATGPSDRRDEQAGYGKATTNSLLVNDKRFQPGGIRNPICL